jgi:hypothetical protein
MKILIRSMLVLSMLALGAGLAGNSSAETSGAEPQACYGYQPVCLPLQVSCCICGPNGLNCAFGCCSR